MGMDDEPCGDEGVEHALDRWPSVALGSQSRGHRGPHHGLAAGRGSPAAPSTMLSNGASASGISDSAEIEASETPLGLM